ncbi:hypothetical protein D3C81_1761750 [compost metagenome]
MICAAKNAQRLSGNTEAVNSVVDAASSNQAGWWSSGTPSINKRVPKAMVKTNTRFNHWNFRALRVNSNTTTRIVKTPMNTSERHVKLWSPIKLRIRS